MTQAVSNEQLYELAIQIYNDLGTLLTKLTDISETVKVIESELSGRYEVPLCPMDLP